VARSSATGCCWAAEGDDGGRGQSGIGHDGDKNQGAADARAGATARRRRTSAPSMLATMEMRVHALSVTRATYPKNSTLNGAPTRYSA
jgi:hypothetical protein